MSGQNGTVLIMGPTGSGKSDTLYGNEGIVVQAVHDIL
jgi:type II secretory ATPase GspE/PulE/Tfp pilus assembly ATPase PilB-like protein